MDLPKLDTFIEKKTIGDAGEILTLYYLKDVLKKEVVRSTGFDRAKDFLVNGKLVELKTDILASKTGNLCIEHTSLHTHTAPILLYMIPKFYWATRENLQHLISYWPDVRNGGDDLRKQTILKIQTDTFAEIFKKI